MPPDPDERGALERAAGTNEIPVLVTDDGGTLQGEEEILPYFDRFHEREYASRHRAKAREEVREFPEVKR